MLIIVNILPSHANAKESDFLIEDGVLIKYTSNESIIKLPIGVIGIGDKAFARCNLRIIRIPEGVKSIGDKAFIGCKKLEQVFIPETVDNIGVNIFIGCTSLVYIKVDEDNPYYSANGKRLYNKDRTILLSYPHVFNEVALHEGIVELGDELFIDAQISKVTLPSTLKRVGNDVFEECGYIKEVLIPASMEPLDNNPFAPCYRLNKLTVYETSEKGNYTEVNGALYSSDLTILYCDPETEQVVVPDTVKEIKGKALCRVTESVVIPNSVTNIGFNIFDNEVEEWTPANEEPLTIYGYKGSAIEKYCNSTNWGIRFLAYDGTYAIKYNLEEGNNNSANPKEFTMNSDAITLKNPTREGYEFQHWYEVIILCEDGCCTEERIITKIPKGTLGDIEVFAKWKKK